MSALPVYSSCSNSLLLAAEQGDADALACHMALDLVFPMAWSSPDEESALCKAARGGHAQCVHLLLGRSVIDKRTEMAFDPLVSAARHGSLECVQMLLPHCNPLACESNGDTALRAAARYGHEECVRALIPHSDVNWSPGIRGNYKGGTILDDSVVRSRVGIVGQLLKAGATADWDWVHRRNPLHTAAAYGFADLVKMLIPFARTDELNDEGATPFLLAAARGHWDCVRILAPVSDVGARVEWGVYARQDASKLARRFHGDEAVDHLQEAIALGTADQIEAECVPVACLNRRISSRL